MGFDALLGNDQLKKNLTGSISRGRISHFYLISGPEGAGKRTLAQLLSAAILCQGQHKPCRSCAPCRKVFGNAHPDFITVDDPDKKTVPVDLIRQARADIYVQPNESAHKIYLFPRAQDMGIPSQNALLKVLEEPPKYGVFILLTDNPEKLLPTVRSRCTELPLLPLGEELLMAQLRREFPESDHAALSAAAQRSGGYLGQAKALLADGCVLPPQTERFIDCFSRRDVYGLLQILVPMEKWKRDQLIPILRQWRELLESALSCRSGMRPISQQIARLSTDRSSRELMDAITRLQKAIDYAQGNVSPAAVCGYLEWALR